MARLLRGDGEESSPSEGEDGETLEEDLQPPVAPWDEDEHIFNLQKLKDVEDAVFRDWQTKLGLFVVGVLA